MSPEEILDFINDCERKFPVEKWKINGIFYWPYLRLNLAQSLNISQLPRFTPPKKTASKLPSTARSINTKLFFMYNELLAYFTDFKLNQNMSIPADILFFTNSVVKIKENNGLFIDRICEPLIKEFTKAQKKYLILETSVDGQHQIPRKRKSSFIGSRMMFLFHSFTKKNSVDCELKGYTSYTKFVNSRNPKAFAPSENELIKFANKFESNVMFFEKHLKIIKPTSVFLICYYSARALALVAACQRQGINSIDIQHGVAGQEHPAYAKWTKIPPDGFAMIPKIFWVWGVGDLETIKKWSNSQLVTIGGNPSLQNWLSASHEEKEFQRKQIESIALSKCISKKLLVTLQPGAPDEKANIPDVLIEAMKNSPKDYFWFLRLHPRMLPDIDAYQEIIDYHGIDNSEFKISSSLNLYTLIDNIDLHLTGWSAVVFEAESLQKKSIVWDQRGNSYFKDLIKTKAVLFEPSAEGILSTIKKLEIKDTVQNHEKSIKNFQNALDFCANLSNEEYT